MDLELEVFACQLRKILLPVQKDDKKLVMIIKLCCSKVKLDKGMGSLFFSCRQTKHIRPESKKFLSSVVITSAIFSAQLLFLDFLFARDREQNEVHSLLLFYKNLRMRVAQNGRRSRNVRLTTDKLSQICSEQREFH